jgi:hypothetical protein
VKNVRVSLLLAFISAVPAYADAPNVDPRHFDTSSTNRTDCDFSGCPPASKATEPKGAVAAPMPAPEPERPMPQDAPWASLSPDEPPDGRQITVHAPAIPVIPATVDAPPRGPAWPRTLADCPALQRGIFLSREAALAARAFCGY